MPRQPLVLPKGSMIMLDGNKLSEHNRSEVSVEVERIGTDKRMANGSMRRYVVADKRTFSMSWNNLPHTSAYTVDGFWGGKEIETFYNKNVGSFPLRVTYGDGTWDVINVMITDFKKTITKRGLYDFWNVDLEMQEV
jgi:hypothetical protein